MWYLLTSLLKPKRNSSDDPEEFRATLVEHIAELRDRIFRSLFVLIVGWIVGWLSERWLYAYLDKMVETAIKKGLPPGADYKPVFPHVTDMFMLQLKLSFMIGLIIAVPWIVMEIWGFVAPGLKPNERKPFMRLLPFALLLFGMGVYFCWLILPFAISWFTQYLVNFPNASLYQNPGDIIFFCVKMLLAFGIGFQLPLIVWILGALNVLSSETLIKYWRQGATFIFVFAAIVTPSNDWFSMLMMAIPLTLLFIVSIFAVNLTQRKQKRIKAAAEAERKAKLAQPVPYTAPQVDEEAEPDEEPPEDGGPIEP